MRGDPGGEGPRVQTNFSYNRGTTERAAGGGPQERLLRIDKDADAPADHDVRAALERGSQVIGDMDVLEGSIFRAEDDHVSGAGADIRLHRTRSKRVILQRQDGRPVRGLGELSKRLQRTSPLD